MLPTNSGILLSNLHRLSLSKLLAVIVHVLQTTQNLVISRCIYAEDGKEIYQELKRTCTVIALLIKSFA